MLWKGAWLYGRDCGFNEELRLSMCSCQCQDPLNNNTRPECSRTAAVFHSLVTSTATLNSSLLIYTMRFSLSLTYPWLNYIQRHIF